MEKRGAEPPGQRGWGGPGVPLDAGAAPVAFGLQQRWCGAAALSLCPAGGSGWWCWAGSVCPSSPAAASRLHPGLHGMEQPRVWGGRYYFSVDLAWWVF